MTKVFVEQPVSLPRSAKYMLICKQKTKKMKKLPKKCKLKNLLQFVTCHSSHATFLCHFYMSYFACHSSHLYDWSITYQHDNSDTPLNKQEQTCLLRSASE